MEGSADEHETTIYHYNKTGVLTFASVNLIITGEIKKRKYIIHYKLNEKGNITQAIQYTDKGKFFEGYRYYYQYWE